jgi:ELWxxDGT repeat protein
LSMAQAPRLVKDLVVGSNGINPTFVTSAVGKVFFADGSRKKLYVSDGSASGTKLLKSFTVVSFLVAAPGRVFIFAGRELWASNGTVGGTTLLGKFMRDFRRNDFMHVAILGKQILFPAYEIRTGIELWKSDGSKSGTQLVKDIHPSGSGSPQWLFSDGSRVWFRASDSKNGPELWASNGTSKGTLLVKDIYPGRFGSSPFGFARLGDGVVFSATDGSKGIEPWISDSSGTRMIKDLSPGARTLRPAGFTEMDGLVYFTTAVGAALWSTDGSSAGTRKIRSLSGTPIGNPVAAGHRLFFRTSFSNLFWVSDGTALGTKIFLGMDTSSGFLVLGDGRVAFISYSRAPTGSELWVTDGTSKGSKAFEVRKGLTSAGASWPARLGNQIFFSATDGKSGQELWVMEALAVGRDLGGSCTKARSYATPPVLGGSMQLDLRRLVQNKIGVFVLGPVIPAGLPFGSCRIFADFANGILFPYLPTTTSHRMQLPIPNSSKFAGLRFAVQNWQLGTGPGGFALGNAIELRAGF